jgi:DNA-binding CsgD family transcriptional regulator
MRINRRSGLMPFEVLVTPVSNSTLGLSFSGPLAAVFIRNPEAQTVMPLDWLRQLYALTGAEARVMQSILVGETLDRIADRTGVTKETLRTQLKAIFLKTSTASQTELVRLGLRGLAAFQGNSRDG